MAMRLDARDAGFEATFAALLATKREDLKGLGESDRMTLLFKKAK